MRTYLMCEFLPDSCIMRGLKNGGSCSRGSREEQSQETSPRGGRSCWGAQCQVREPPQTTGHRVRTLSCMYMLQSMQERYVLVAHAGDITTRPEAIDEEGGYSERAIDVPGEENEIARKEAAAAATLSRVLKARVAARRKAKADALKAEGKTENGARNGFSSTSAGVQNSLASESATTGAPTASVSRPATDMGSMCNRFPMETESSSLSKAEDDEEDEEDTATFDEEGNRKRPPKIWISKSASMEHDLD